MRGVGGATLREGHKHGSPAGPYKDDCPRDARAALLMIRILYDLRV